ncbi:MAG: hypothetical protein NVSMB2_12620 [Chloroflexota bacterium]
MPDMAPEDVRKRVGADLSDEEVIELMAAYAALARGIAAFPLPELHGVEPPMTSVAGPRNA